MRKPLILVSLLILSLVLGCTGKRVKLEYKFKKGDVLRYKQITTAKVEFKMTNRKPETISIKKEMYQTIKIEDIDNKGVAQANETIEGVIENERNGEKTSEFFDFSNRPILMSITKEGKTEIKNWEECKAIFKELEMPAIMDQFFPLLPEKKIKVGDSWTYDVRLTSLLFDTPPLTIQFKDNLVGFEKMGGYDCAKILSVGSIEVPMQKGKVLIPKFGKKTEVTIKDSKIKRELTTHFAYKEGKPIRMDGKITAEEKRIYKRLRRGREQSWEVDVESEVSFVLTEATAEEYKAWKEEIAKRKFKKPLRKTEAWRYYKEGENYYQEGKYDQAIASFKKTLEQKPETPWLIAWIHVELGWAYDKKGLKREAKKEYKYVLKFAETVKEKDERLLRAIRAAQNKLK